MPKQFIPLVLIIALLITGNAIPAFDKNLAYLSLNQALGTSKLDIEERQNQLQKYLAYAGSNSKSKSTVLKSSEGVAMTPLQAFFVGEYYRLHNEEERAIAWYSQFAQADTIPRYNGSLSYTWRDNLAADGNIMINDFIDGQGWLPGSKNNAVGAVLESTDGIAKIAYENRRDQRDLLAYALFPNSNEERISYHNVLSIRVKVETGSYLTVESVTINEERKRHLHYNSGSGGWEILRFPLSGGVLREIKLIVSEPSEPDDTANYTIWVDWIKLELSS